MRTTAPVAIALVLLAAVAGSALGCAPPLRRVSEGQFREILRGEVEGCVTPSLVVAVVEEQELVFAQAAGEADLASGRLATLDTVYLLFSISKIFAATAVMQLVDRGLVDLDRPVTEYLPELTIDNPFDTPVTVRHLLSHSSGLDNPLPFAWARPAREPRMPLAQHAAEVLAESGTITFEPGTSHRYTNVGYLLLGLLVEEVTGSPYEEHLREHLLEPLGMERTGFTFDDAMLADHATGHVVRGSLYHLLARAFAAPELFGPLVGTWATTRPYLIRGSSYGGMVGTAREVARLLSVHLSGGTYRGRRILSEESVRAMQQVQRTPSGEALPYALGWHVGQLDGVRYYNHMGSGGGFRTAARIYPDLGQGLVVLTNRTRYNPRGLTHTLLDGAPATKRR